MIGSRMCTRLLTPSRFCSLRVSFVPLCVERLSFNQGFKGVGCWQQLILECMNILDASVLLPASLPHTACMRKPFPCPPPAFLPLCRSLALAHALSRVRGLLPSRSRSFARSAY